MRFAIALAVLLSASPALGQSRPATWRPENYLAVDPIGFAGFLRLNIGSYEVSYERNFERHHAVRVAFDFIHVHQNAEHVANHQWTFGGSLAYRYYFGPGVGPFAGVQVGYRRGFGHFGHDGQPEHTRLGNEQLRVMGQVGYRFWAPALQLSVVPKVALGYGPYNVWAVDRNDAAGEAAAVYARDVLAPLALVLETGLDIAIGF